MERKGNSQRGESRAKDKRFLKKKLVWLKKSNSYRDIHNDGKCNDKNDVKVSEKGSLGGEGGEEEADEGDAARVGDGQGEQAEK